MARRRMIASDIWADEKIAELDPIERLLFIGMVTQANDAGKLRGNVSILKSRIFPYDKIDNQKIEKGINKIEALGIIITYKANGEKFIKLNNWFKHQTLTYKGKDTIPDPPPSLTNPESTLNEHLIASKDKSNKENLKEAKEREEKLIIQGQELLLQKRVEFKKKNDIIYKISN